MSGQRILTTAGDPVTRVMLVDDQLMFTEALAASLSALPDLRVVGRCVTTAPDLYEKARALAPDVISVELVTVPAPARMLELLREAAPDTQLMTLTAARDVKRAVDAARAGLSAWVPKDRGADQFVTVLRGVVRGHAYFPPDLLGAVLRELRSDVRRAIGRTGPLDTLSRRERDVLESMVRGRRGSDIAEELGISPDTVRTHMRSIFAKLEVHSQLEAMSVARAAGLNPRPDPGSREPDGPGRST